MTGALPFVLPGILAGFVLAGIHAYIGSVTIEREMIFAGLTLAQLAALGSSVAVLAGFDLRDSSAHFFAIGFTLFGAALLSLIPPVSRPTTRPKAIAAVFTPPPLPPRPSSPARRLRTHPSATFSQSRCIPS